MVIPRSRSRSIVSRSCSRIWRFSTAPVASMRRSARVDFPWSMWATMQKLRMRDWDIGARIYTPGTAARRPFRRRLAYARARLAERLADPRRPAAGHLAAPARGGPRDAARHVHLGPQLHGDE